MKYYVGVGPIYEPEAFSAIAGKQVDYSIATLSGYEIAFQPFDKISEPVHGTLESEWGAKFLGAYCPRRRSGFSFDVNVYAVEDEDVARVEENLADWNMYEDEWFEMVDRRVPLNGKLQDVRMEVIKDQLSLETAPIKYRRRADYKEFSTEMTRRLRLVYGQSSEGQMGLNPEGYTGPNPERL